MIAAVPRRSDSLELFKVALSLIASGHSVIPKQLQIFVEEVLVDAQALASHADNVSARHRESIDLALELRQDPGLADDVAKIEDFASIHPHAAAKIIGSMEYHPA